MKTAVFMGNALQKYSALLLAVLIFAAFAARADAQSASRYTVRSELYTDRAQAVKFSQEVGSKGFHPVIQDGRTQSGDFYYLDMGTFGSVDTAQKLVIALKEMGYEFLVVDSSDVTGPPQDLTGSPIVPPAQASNLFPSGGQAPPGQDVWNLLDTIPAPKPKTSDRDTIPDSILVPATSLDNPPVQPTPPAPKQPQNPQTDASALSGGKTGFITSRPKMMKIEETPPPKATPTEQVATDNGTQAVEATQPQMLNVPALSQAASQLRDIAWELRSHGYGVYFEGETTMEPSGILTGQYEAQQDADDLVAELDSYGYKAIVKKTATPDGEQYNVYTTVGPNDLPPPMVTTLGGEPTMPPGSGATAQPPANTPLLKLNRPKKNPVIKPVLK